MGSTSINGFSGQNDKKCTIRKECIKNIKIVGTEVFYGEHFKVKEGDLFDPKSLKIMSDIGGPPLRGSSPTKFDTPKKRIFRARGGSRGRGNPILKSIRNVPWEFGEIVPDYTMGVTTCALFLSLRYHNLNPNYIHDRLKQLGKTYELRILLVQVDVKDPHHELKQLSKICILADMTLMLSWSADEAGRIIEVYKMFEHKPPDLIMEKQESNPYSMLIDALTSIKSVNRTDAMTLLSNFGSLEKIIGATQEELSVCPGLGPQKAQRLYTVLHQQVQKYPSPRKKSQPIKSTIFVNRSENISSISSGSTSTSTGSTSTSMGSTSSSSGSNL
ncbi:unnamed protein product, partial [Meganyctiphanes norvegica]